MKHNLSFIFFFPLLLIGNQEIIYSQEKDTLSIIKILALVETKSREIEIAKSVVQAKQSLYQDTKNQALPSLGIFAQADKASNMPIYSNGLFNKPEQHEVIHTLYQSGANLYLNLYSGLKSRNQIKIAKLEQSLSQENLKKTTASIKLKAIYLYYDLDLQNEWSKIIRVDIALKIKEIEEIKNLYQKGVILESDVIRAELEISKRKLTLLEIENESQILNQQLNVLIGKEDHYQLFPIADATQLTTLEPLQKYIEKGILNSYDEKISNFHVSIVHRKADLAKSNNSIQLGIVGSFQFSNPQIFLYPYNPSWYSLGIIGMKASYDISSLYKNKHKVSAAKIEVHEAHVHHEKIQDDIRSQIYEAYYKAQEAHAHINIQNKNIQFTKENERIIQNAYFSQTALITDLLDANLQVLQAQFEFKQAQINIYKTQHYLSFATGNL